MKRTRTDKLKALQDALNGQTNALQQLKRQQAKAAMPYLEVRGIINAHNCPPALLDQRVLFSYFPSLRTSMQQQFCTVREYLQLYSQIEPKLRPFFGEALGLLNVDNTLYDAVPLDFIEVVCRDCRQRYCVGGTIADLRRYYHQSAQSCEDRSYLQLSFERKEEEFAWYRTHLLTPES